MRLLVAFAGAWLAVVISITTAGCSIPYTKLGASDEQVRADRAWCWEAAIRKYREFLLPEPRASVEVQQCMAAKGYRVPVP